MQCEHENSEYTTRETARQAGVRWKTESVNGDDATTYHCELLITGQESISEKNILPVTLQDLPFLNK